MMRTSIAGLKPCAALLLVLCASACASAPPAAAVKPGTPAFDQKVFEQKMASILRLEDQRMLRDPGPTLAPPAPVTVRGQQAAAAAPTLPPDLTRLLTDDEARIRRRAA